MDISKPYTLPNGLTIPNRLVKAAMAEMWADGKRLPSPALIKSYGSWADGGWGMLLTGNVQVDAAYLGTPRDVALNREKVPREVTLASWTQWAKEISKNGTPAIMQLNHPGRQSTIGAGSRSYFAKTIAPSAIPLNLGSGFLANFLRDLVFGTPREMTINEIHDVIGRFTEAALLASDAGFAGIQLHAAHGYLLAQFLSAKANHRGDEYGGSPKNRSKIVMDIIQAIRKVVPEKFAVGIKLNSVDHQSQAEFADCVEQLEAITGAGVDFLEISGGNYEDPTMVNGPKPKAESTRAREAFFLDFAHVIRDKFPSVPLMVTGGFRTRQGMEAALQEGACDLIGIARPAVLNPSLPNNTIFNHEVKDADAKLYTKNVPVAFLARLTGIKMMSGGAETGWYSQQIHRM